MYRRDDPRFRRQLTQLSHNLENANEAAQERLYSLTEHCLKPCLVSIGNCVRDSTATCFPRREDRPRRSRPRPRGRPEASFDFYDDWEQDETDALLAWEDDELEGLLSPDDETEPGRRGPMNYGTRNDTRNPRTKPRRLGMSYDHEDPTYIPKNSYFGFLERLPFRFGGRGLRYRPSAADLKIRPKEGGGAKGDDERSGQEESAAQRKDKHTRNRSLTNGSERSAESYSSRGDIFPSDEEDDAVPLDDEFAVGFEPQSAASGKDDSSSGKTRSSKRKTARRKLKRTESAKSRGSDGDSTSPASTDFASNNFSDESRHDPNMSDLRIEEQEVQAEEERDVKLKRMAAQKLAEERGLSSPNGPSASEPNESRLNTETPTVLEDLSAHNPKPP